MLPITCIGLAALAVTTLIVAVTILGERWVKKNDMVALAAPPNSRIHNFHRAEFEVLHAEIAELIKFNTANFQYALLASGGIFAWLAATYTPKEASVRWPVSANWASYAWLLPLILSCLLSTLSLATYFQIKRLGRYLAILEDSLGDKSIGWEKFFRRRAETRMTYYFIAWVALLIGDFLVAIYVPMR
jgi:hypothetical protein